MTQVRCIRSFSYAYFQFQMLQNFPWSACFACSKCIDFIHANNLQNLRESKNTCFFFTLFRCPSKQNQIHFFIEKKWKRFSERKIYIHILSTLNSQHSTMYFIYKFVYKQCIDCCVWFSFVDLSAENLFLIFFFRFFFLISSWFVSNALYIWLRTDETTTNQ